MTLLHCPLDRSVLSSQSRSGRRVARLVRTVIIIRRSSYPGESVLTTQPRIPPRRSGTVSSIPLSVHHSRDSSWCSSVTMIHCISCATRLRARKRRHSHRGGSGSFLLRGSLLLGRRVFLRGRLLLGRFCCRKLMGNVLPYATCLLHNATSSPASATLDFGGRKVRGKYLIIYSHAYNSAYNPPYN